MKAMTLLGAQILNEQIFGQFGLQGYVLIQYLYNSYFYGEFGVVLSVLQIIKQTKNQMTNKNEVNEIFSYISNKNCDIAGDRLTQIYSAIYGNAEQLSGSPNVQAVGASSSPSVSRAISKSQFEQKLADTLKQKNIDEELLCLFYHLDRDKKGYLTPDDILAVFKALDKNITINEIENSFKYVKVYKNKMTFDDFKEYFHNF